MSTHIAIVASLGLALFLSPETFVLGFVIASDRKAPKRAAWAYAAGGVLGILFSFGIGMLLATETSLGTGGAAVTGDHAWRKFVVHAVLATVLLVIGTRRAIGALTQEPIAEPEQEKRTSRLWASFRSRFPSFAHLVDPASDLPMNEIALRGALAGFAVCGLHPKIFPVAIAAGHQIEDMPAHIRPLGALVFILLGAGATFVPAILETLRPGSAGTAKETIERLMKVYGRTAIALLLIGVGLHMARRAWELYPG